MNLRQLNQICLIVVLLGVSSVPAHAQRPPITACRTTALTAFKKLPELHYECPEALDESDDKILKLPERIAELSRIANKLELFTDAAWWQATVADLNACEIHGQAGELTAEEKEKFTSGDYRIGLFGNHSVRMILVTDPCYQTGYNGSVAFLLARESGRVFATLILDGYYSRVDTSVGIDFANLNGQRIIEVSTSNNMPPTITNYYYVIDPQTHQAVPKNLFKTGQKLTNLISSAMILGEPNELGLPRNAQDMELIRRNRMLTSFSTYAETFAGDGRRLKRTVYRWNGRVYVERR